MITRTRSALTLGIALGLCLVSMVGAGLVQSGFGSARITNVALTTGRGTLAGYLLVPRGATASQPAPAVVASHGYLNNREMQDITYVELSRRGYVVFAMDAYRHGDSSVPVNGKGQPVAVADGGMVDAVEYLHTLPFVDHARIGVVGHSMGGGFVDTTLAHYSTLEKEALASGRPASDAAALNKVKAGLLVGNVPTGLPGGTDLMGTVRPRGAPYLAHVGVIEGRYDEFAIALAGGPVVSMLQSERVKRMAALQAEDPSILSAPTLVEGRPYVNARTGYAFVFYAPWETHVWNHFSTASSRHTVDFFQATLGAPSPSPGTNQVWRLKELLNLVGLIGFFMFLVPCADLLLAVPFFRGLRAASVPPVPALASAGQKRRFWIAGIAGSLLAAALVLPLFVVGMALVTPFWPQDTTGPIGLWAAGAGLVGLAVARTAGGRASPPARRPALLDKARRPALLKTVALAAAVVFLAYLLVFAADAFFKTDFRFWTFDVRAFSARKIWVALKYAPFFLVFFLANSLLVSRNRFEDWTERKQVWVSALLNVLGVVAFLALQYLPLLTSGTTFFGTLFTGRAALAFGGLVPILLYPFVPILAVAAFIAIRMYKLTGSIYLGGIVNALLFTMITVANTSFTYPY